MPPVGKSGPLIWFINPRTSISGLSIYAMHPSITSLKLWGGIFVAIPTAIPIVPFTRIFGNLDGKTVGSFSLSSKFGVKLTVSFLISLNNSKDIFDSLDSV